MIWGLYSTAEIKCPVGLLLFRGGLSTLRRPRTQYLSAMGPMRSLFEVWAIAGIIYRRPDTSIKPMQFTDVTSFASWWRHRLLSVFTFSFITLTNLGQFSSPIPVFESVLNLLSSGVISCLIVWSFDIALIRNRFTFVQILLLFFRKNIFKRKF